MSSQRREEYVHEEVFQERLQILLDRLTWSYVALWTLNPRTRELEWKRGHFQGAGTKEGTASSSPTVWDAQLFYTTYQSCSFAPGAGAVGRANLEGKHIWLTGDAVCQNAGSLEQSQFLTCAKIQTTMCIPWVDSVLEIGTTKLAGENFLLMDQIQQVLSNDLLEPDHLEHASQSAGPSGATMFQRRHQDSSHDHPTNLALQPPSSLRSPSPSTGVTGDHRSQRSGFQSELSLSDQVWRSAASPNLSLSSDIFMQEPAIQPNSHINSVKETLSFTLDTGASSMQMPAGSSAPAWRSSEINFCDSQQAVNQSHGLMVSQADQYRSWSGAAASSSVSSQRDSSARPSVSPEMQQQIHVTSSPNSHFSAHDRTSSSVRQLYSQLANPYTRSNGSRNLSQIRRTTSCGDQYEIQKALSLFEAQEKQDQRRRQAELQLTPASELPANSDATVAKTLPFSPPGQDKYGRSPSPAQYNESTNLPAGQNLQFQGWQRDGGSPDPTLQIQTSDPSNRPTLKRSSNASIMNQVSKVAGPLLRRQSLSALEVLKAVGTYQKEAAEDVLNVSYGNVQVCEEPRPAHVQIITSNLRGRRRTMGVELGSSSGPVHAGHDEAAVNHMLAERRRRVKQKENFTALRSLVPIISKADKASTLVDAITYLKHLQTQIQEMEASKEDIDQRCESLENKCKKLEERNQELTGLINSKDQPGNLIHLNYLKLLPTKSI